MTVAMNALRASVLVVAAATLLAMPHLGAQQPNPAGAVHVLPIKGNIWMLTAGGSNVVASIGKDGVMLVDTGAAAMSSTLLAAVQALDRQVTSMGVPQKSCVGIVQGCSWWNSSTFLPTTAA